MNFPMCFKYPDNKTWIRIISFVEFEELQVIGNKYQHHFIVAQQYPEKLKIMDMIDNKEQRLCPISNEEFEHFWNELKTNKIAIGTN